MFLLKFNRCDRTKYIYHNIKYKKLKVHRKDTLIIRVGRNTGLVFRAKNNYVGKYVSDYFYLLKDIKLSDIERKEIQHLLFKKRKGLTTKYLSKGDIINSIKEISISI
ncbi:MAG: hypothetical protein L3J20_11530 [Flavobacteriaceae bacterium]|nr:hypothetical protein [Flavobacteriaceae bacterium]